MAIKKDNTKAMNKLAYYYKDKKNYEEMEKYYLIQILKMYMYHPIPEIPAGLLALLFRI